MRVYGVPEGGKRVKLTDRLSILVPGGAVYGKNDDGNYSIKIGRASCRERV